MARNNLAPVDDVELPAGPFDVPVDRAGLTIPRLRVVPIDGDPYEVQALNPDMINWEETAARHGWKANTPGVAPFKWLTFLAWSAARRGGLTDLSWEQFAATTAQVTDVSKPADTARPTLPGPDPG
jgi:hypothetical protein